MDAKLGRAVLTHIEDHPHLFDTTTWAEDRPSGVVADIAGRALLLSDWTLVEDNTFRDPDDKYEIHHPDTIEAEACAVLGLTQDELWDSGDLYNLFTLNDFAAVARLRELLEAAEADTDVRP